MEIAPQIRFRGMEPAPHVEAAIRRHIDRLRHFHKHITSCTVVVEAPHRHSRTGEVYHVRVDVIVPGREIVVGREPEENHAHEDVLVAVRDSFDAARRQLEDVVRTMSGHQVKPHPERLHGTILRLVPEEGFGFIGLADGREVFFRQESMSKPEDWPLLGVGSAVRFSGHDGDKGAYASAVTLT